MVIYADAGGPPSSNTGNIVWQH